MKLYDSSGNEILIDTNTDKTLSMEGVPADAGVVGQVFDGIGASAVEPMFGDIPELYIIGTIPTSKDDGKLPVKISYRSRTMSFDEYATLKVQGNTSTTFPKKNFNIQFYSDQECTVKKKHSFKGWGNQSKFTLKANWIDITHARNIISARLWTDIVKSRSDYLSLPTKLLSSPNLGVIDGFVVKMYVNGIYQGRYTLNIPKDKWMFNMDDKLDTNAVLYSEGLKCLFKEDYNVAIDGTDWTDEIHEDDVPTAVINKFNAMIRFVATSSDSAFVSSISNYIDVTSFIDYYLFGFVNCGFDSFGKNQMLIYYDNGVYIANVYDLDTTWGLYWNGQTLLASDYAESEYITKNNLYVRLKALFPLRIKSRYESLRSGALSTANIIHRFEEFMDIMSKELIEADYATTTANGAFVNIPSKNITSLAQIRNYVADRLDYVDSQILT